MEQLSVLRSTAQRLTLTPVEELPRIAGFLASSLASCSRLGSEDDQKSIDFSGPLHRLKTRLSSLLQGRSAAERLTAAIVIKAYVETVQPAEASQWEAWGRGLITCLNKPDPWEAKAIYVSTLTRILHLCSGSATLQREVVSPLLPAFLNASLGAVKPTTAKDGEKEITIPSPLLPTALRSWDELLRHFSQTFRPFVTRIRQVCLMLLESSTTSEALQRSAIDTLCLLHLCAPKSTASNDWDQSVANIILATHQSLDIVFRGVIEDWVSTSTSLSRRDKTQNFSKPQQLLTADSTGMQGWAGLYAGVDRAAILLQWLGAAHSHPSHASNVPFGALIDLTARITGVTVPTANNHIKTSSEVSKDEREELWSNLPRLHIQAMDLISNVYNTFGQATMPFSASLCAHVLDVYEVERWNPNIREACYKTIEVILRTNHTLGLPLNTPAWLSMLKSCCKDLLADTTAPTTQTTSTLANDKKKPSATTHPTSSTTKPPTPLKRAARSLLLIAYKHTSSTIPHSIRTEMDRTAILLNDEDLLLASTMNPARHRTGARSQPSLLPFLARSAGGAADGGSLDYGVETLLRPRLPALSMQQGGHIDLDGDDDDEEEAEEDVAMDYGDDQSSNILVDQSTTAPDVRNRGNHEDATHQQTLNSNKTTTQAIAVPSKRKSPSNDLPPLQHNMESNNTTADQAIKRLRHADPKPTFAPPQPASLASNGASAPPPAEVASFSGSDAIVFHEPTAAAPTVPSAHTEAPLPDSTAAAATTRTVVPDSDDSDIPEIDPELATDSEDEE